MNQESKQIMQELYAAINARNLDRASAFFSDNGEFKVIAFDKAARGSREIRQLFDDWIRAFPDLKLDTKNIFAAEGAAAAELLVQGTHKGTFKTPGGEIPATGKNVRVPACDVIQTRNGKITSLHCYLESGTMMRQLGIATAKASAA